MVVMNFFGIFVELLIMWEIYLIISMFFMDGLGEVVISKFGIYGNRDELFLVVVVLVFIVEFWLLIG